jgi:hypothetical protein
MDFRRRTTSEGVILAPVFRQYWSISRTNEEFRATMPESDEKTMAAVPPARDGGSSISLPVSFEEFRLYYESAEKVTERRLSTNRWNYSVSTAIIVAIGGILSWSTSHETFRFVAAIGTLFLSGMAFFFCSYWIKQIDDFKALNRAKFAVLENMSPNVVFDESGSPLTERSFEPFRKEWENLESARALQPVPGRLERVMALRSTRQEYFLPKAFCVLFVVTFLITLLFVVLSHNVIFTHISPFSSDFTNAKAR